MFLYICSFLWSFSVLFEFFNPYYYYYYLHWSFSHRLTLMVFHWSLSDRKSLQVSRTLLSILAVLNNVVVWMVSTRPPTSKSFKPSSYCTKSTNHNWYNCHPHFPQFFQFSCKVEVSILRFILFQFYSVVIRNSKVDNFASSPFLLLLIIIRSGRLYVKDP